MRSRQPPTALLVFRSCASSKRRPVRIPNVGLSVGTNRARKLILLRAAFLPTPTSSRRPITSATEYAVFGDRMILVTGTPLSSARAETTGHRQLKAIGSSHNLAGHALFPLDFREPRRDLPRHGQFAKGDRCQSRRKPTQSLFRPDATRADSGSRGVSGRFKTSASKARRARGRTLTHLSAETKG